MNAALVWRAEFYKPGHGPGVETLVGHVDGDAKAVAVAEAPEGAYTKLRLLTPPDIRVGDHVRYDNGDDEPFTAVVARVGQKYPSGTFNVDLLNGGTQTVFCENCTVIFRPRHRAWKEDEVADLFPARVEIGPEPEITLFGREFGKVAKILRGTDGWTISFWSGDVMVDSKFYSEKVYGRIRELVRAANAWIFAQPVKVGDYWTQTINQGPRDVEVVAVKKLRYRIEYEMPNAGMMSSWQTGILIGGKLYA